MAHPYTAYDPTRKTPRLPREGSIDLTYRCNFQCRHCWVRVNGSDGDRPQELSLDEIAAIAVEARKLGCRAWTISGGEPMLRPDFPEILDLLTRAPFSYSLNSNGSLITPAIAKLLTRRGNKMIALYGADAAVQDAVTRQPGSFEAAMQGMQYLKEAGAGFTVQIIPMRSNYHQFDKMVALARQLSPSWRIGAAWLFLTADRLAGRNAVIKKERLPAETVNIIDPAIPACGPPPSCARSVPGTNQPHEHQLFAACVNESQQFHIDPWGGMSFCSTIKDPAARFSLREHTFEKIWEFDLPAYAGRTFATAEYHENCGRCALKNYCHWCGAYAWLETGRTSAPVRYLCEIARERRKFDEDWRSRNRRCFNLAGLELQVDSDLPFREDGFAHKFNDFYIQSAGDDALRIRHHYALPEPSLWAGGELVYDKTPWQIYRKGDLWIYLGIGRKKKHLDINTVAIFNSAHTIADIYHHDDRLVRQARFCSLTALPSDHIMLAHPLANHQAMVMHSSGLVLHGQGYLFAGQSGAGKSTVIKLLRDYGYVLCDDRVVVRKWPEGFRLHGTWSHGEIPVTSNLQAPLKAILLLKKARRCKIEPILDPAEIIHALLIRVARPVQTAEWLKKVLDLLGALAGQVPVFRLSFTRDARIVEAMETLTGPLQAIKTSTSIPPVEIRHD